MRNRRSLFLFLLCEELLEHCTRENKTIAEIMLENEKTWASEAEVKKHILEIWQVMKELGAKGLRNRRGFARRFGSKAPCSGSSQEIRIAARRSFFCFLIGLLYLPLLSMKRTLRVGALSQRQPMAQRELFPQHCIII